MLLKILTVFILAYSLSHSLGGEPFVRLQVKNLNGFSVSSLRNLGYDVIATKKEGIQIFASREEWAMLRGQVDVRVLDYARPNGVPHGYHSPQEVYNILNSTAAKYPKIAKVVDLNAEYLHNKPTAEGRHILAIKISKDINQELDLPAIQVVGAHHAREIAAPELSLEYVKRITEGFAKKEPEFVDLLNKYVVWVAPIVNIDGYHYVFEYNNMWRKNRFGGYGIDNNRNYDLGWNGPCSGDDYKQSETYRGASAASEIETQTIKAWSLAENFAKVMDYHSYGEEVLYSYVCMPIPDVIANFMQSEAEAIGNQCGYGTRKPSGDGEHQEFAVSAHTTYAFLQELDGSFQPPYEETLEDIKKVWPSSMHFMTRPISITGHVRSTSGQPLKAQIKVKQVEWKNGETRFSHPKFGRYHDFLPAGRYDFTFSAAGFKSTSITVNIKEGETLVQDVQLARSD